jgi:hypothetical protein
MVLGPFAPQQRLRPSGRAKQQVRLPGRNPALQSQGQGTKHFRRTDKLKRKNDFIGKI